MPTPLTDADKVIRNDTGKEIADAIRDLAAPEADKVAYDNTSSGLTADNAQDAIDELNQKVESADTLEELTDTSIQNKKTGDILEYDSSISKWKNVNKILEKSISDSIISFEDGGDNIPVKNVVADITAVQAGEGTPSPSNVRTINGFDSVEIVRSGKNLWSLGDITSSENDIPFSLKAGTYNLSGTRSGTSMPSISIRFYYADGTSTVCQLIGTNSYSNSVTLTADVVKINKYITADSLVNVQLEKGSSKTTFEAYKGTTYTISLGSTVYGGTLDVTKGILTVTYKIITDLGDVVWTLQDSNHIFRTPVSDIKNPTNNAERREGIICSCYKPSESVLLNASMDNEGMLKLANQLYVRDNAYSDAKTFKSSLSGQQFAYELATPVVIQLTPTKVKTLLGENNIYANSGNVSVEYFTQSAKDISDVANSSNKMDFSNPTGTGSLSIGRKSGTKMGLQSVAVGYNTEASGARSHAEGEGTTASGSWSHSENINTVASGDRSHCEGYKTEATRRSQHVFGEFNILDTQGADATVKGKYIEIVGKGSDNEHRSNARTLDWSGNETLAGGLKLHTNQDAATLNVSSSISPGSTFNFTDYPDGTIIFVYRPADAGQSDYTGIYIRATNWARLIPIKAAPNITTSGYVLTNGNSQSLRCAIIST